MVVYLRDLDLGAEVTFYTRTFDGHSRPAFNFGWVGPDGERRVCRLMAGPLRVAGVEPDDDVVYLADRSGQTVPVYGGLRIRVKGG